MSLNSRTSGIAVSVVIPTHRLTQRKMSVLRELLGSLERQGRRIDFEVLVVANLPEPGLKKIVESYGPRFRFLETGRLGVNIARNKGLERARGEIVLFLDDDCYLPDKDFIERIHSLHTIHPQATAIGGPYLLRDGANTCETAYHLMLDRAFESSKRRYDETTHLHGGNWSIKIAAFDAKPRFEDSIVFGGSDIEMLARLRQQGHALLALDSIAVVHRLKLGLTGLLRRAYARGLEAGRAQAREDHVRHWNSTLTTRECAARQGIAWNRRLEFYVSLFERVFYVAAAKGKILKSRPLPSLSIGKLIAVFLPRTSRAELVRSITVACENAWTIAKRKTPFELR